MNDLEISKRLALAIGWREDDLTIANDALFACVYYQPFIEGFYGWQVFDYRDWDVIGPIAERYECFPCKSGDVWACSVGLDGPVMYADTPQKAIAMAVIKVTEKGINHDDH